MSLRDVVEELVEERSLEALERLTGTQNEEILEALIQAASRLIQAESFDDDEDRIVEEIRQHLVDSKAQGPLIDALRDPAPSTREFALACLGEIGDSSAVPAMIPLLKDKDAGVREAAAEHLALLTSYDFGQDAKKWQEWHDRLVQGRVEQAVEDAEDKEKLLRLRLKGKRHEEEKEEEAPEPEYDPRWR